MWPIIGALLGNITGPIGEYFKTKAAIAQAEQHNKLEIRKAELTMATEVAKANVEQSKNQLRATSQSFKYVSYILLTAPIIILCVWPARGLEIFHNLGLMPSWYAQLYAMVVGVIWGLPIASSAVSNMFQAINSAWEARQNVKIQKIQVLGEAGQIGKDEAKKEIFDTMKKAVGLNGYTQAQVDLIAPVLDKVLGKDK